MVPTFFTTLAVGTLTTMVASIIALSAWLPGSQILQGNLFFDTTNNGNPGIYVNTVKLLAFTGSTTTPNAVTFDSTNSQAACQKYGSRHFDCYQQVVFTATGGCVAGGCGTKSYNVASVTKPYTGSGVIKRVEVTCDNQGKATTIDVGQVAAVTASGSEIMADKLIGSGTLFSRAGFGNTLLAIASGATVWSETTPFLKVSSNSTVGPHQACLLSVWSDEMYNP